MESSPIVLTTTSGIWIISKFMAKYNGKDRATDKNHMTTNETMAVDNFG